MCCIIMWLGGKRVLYYRIHIEFACSEVFFFKSAILMHSDFRKCFPFNERKCALFYFSIVFRTCFHTISQDIQLSTLILYLFCYNLLLYHSYDN